MASRNPVIEISAKDKTKKAFRGVKQSLGNLKESVFSMKSALVSLAGAAGFGALVKSSLTSIDALAKTADKLGTTTEKMAGLHLAAEVSGIKVNTMNMALQRLTRRSAEAAMGTGEAKNAIAELGLDARQFALLEPDEKMLELADAMEKVGTQGDRVRLAFKLFDSEGAALVNTLALGRDGLEQMQREARALGLAVSSIDAIKIEQANDAMTKVKGVMKGVGNTIAVELAPYLQAISEYLVEASIKSEGFKTHISGGMQVAIQAVGLFFDAIRGLEFAWLAVQLAFSTAAEFIIAGLVDIDRVLVDTLNKLPLMSLEYSHTLEQIAASQKAATDQIAADMETLVTTPLPSAGVEEFFANIQAKSVAAAREIAIKKATIRDEDNAAAAAAAQAAQAVELDALYAFEDAKFEASRRGSKRQLAFDTWTAKKKTETVIDQAIALTRGVTGQSKALFNINKAAGIANATISAWTGAAKTMEAYPYPLNIALAGLSLAAGLAQVQQIRSASFGGGGGGGSVGGGGVGGIGGAPSPPSDFGTPTTDLFRGPTEITITVDGTGKLDRDQAAEIAESLREYVRDGGEALA